MSPDSFLQYGSFGLLAFMMFWFTAKIVPELLKRHSESMDHLSKAIHEVKETNEKQTEALSRLFQIVVLHDATVRGVNDDTTGSTEDILKAIHRDFEL